MSEEPTIASSTQEKRGPRVPLWARIVLYIIIAAGASWFYYCHIFGETPLQAARSPARFALGEQLDDALKLDNPAEKLPVFDSIMAELKDSDNEWDIYHYAKAAVAKANLPTTPPALRDELLADVLRRNHGKERRLPGTYAEVCNAFLAKAEATDNKEDALKSLDVILDDYGDMTNVHVRRRVAKAYLEKYGLLKNMKEKSATYTAAIEKLDAETDTHLHEYLALLRLRHAKAVDKKDISHFIDLVERYKDSDDPYVRRIIDLSIYHCFNRTKNGSPEQQALLERFSAIAPLGDLAAATLLKARSDAAKTPETRRELAAELMERFNKSEEPFALAAVIDGQANALQDIPNVENRMALLTDAVDRFGGQEHSAVTAALSRLTSRVTYDIPRDKESLLLQAVVAHAGDNPGRGARAVVANALRNQLQIAGSRSEATRLRDEVIARYENMAELSGSERGTLHTAIMAKAASAPDRETKRQLYAVVLADPATSVHTRRSAIRAMAYLSGDAKSAVEAFRKVAETSTRTFVKMESLACAIEFAADAEERAQIADEILALFSSQTPKQKSAIGNHSSAVFALVTTIDNATGLEAKLAACRAAANWCGANLPSCLSDPELYSTVLWTLALQEDASPRHADFMALLDVLGKVNGTAHHVSLLDLLAETASDDGEKAALYSELAKCYDENPALHYFVNTCLLRLAELESDRKAKTALYHHLLARGRDKDFGDLLYSAKAVEALMALGEPGSLHTAFFTKLEDDVKAGRLKAKTLARLKENLEQTSPDAAPLDEILRREGFRGERIHHPVFAFGSWFAERLDAFSTAAEKNAYMDERISEFRQRPDRKQSPHELEELLLTKAYLVDTDAEKIALYDEILTAAEAIDITELSPHVLEVVVLKSRTFADKEEKAAFLAPWLETLSDRPLESGANLLVLEKAATTTDAAEAASLLTSLADNRFFYPRYRAVAEFDFAVIALLRQIETSTDAKTKASLTRRFAEEYIGKPLRSPISIFFPSPVLNKALADTLLNEYNGSPSEHRQTVVRLRFASQATPFL